MPAEFQERRRHSRFTCDLGVEVKTLDAKSGYWGTLGDISLGGCYIYTYSPLPSGADVALRIKTEGAEIAMVGKVVAFHPGVGMGIEFQGGSMEGAENNLKDLIGSLERKAAASM
ncbi:MAG TPA: PilZ domain-containing protein [Candidatus Angelobacter sp.]|nr:PilZ domain-containing protein [Candidatus Angelobacter sp.]